jgi:hypothetical protein
MRLSKINVQCMTEADSASAPHAPDDAELIEYNDEMYESDTEKMEPRLSEESSTENSSAIRTTEQLS